MRCIDPQKTIVPCIRFLQRCIKAELRLPTPRLDLTVRSLHTTCCWSTPFCGPTDLCDHGDDCLLAGLLHIVTHLCVVTVPYRSCSLC